MALLNTLQKGSLVSGKFRKDLSFATIASIASFAISLALTPIMTRWYQPEDYGLFAVINNTSTFVATLTLFSLSNAIAMQKEWSKRARLIRTLLHLAFMAFLLSGIFVFVYALVQYEYDGQLDYAYYLMPFLILAISLHRIAQGWVNADGDFFHMSAARIAHPLIAKPFAIVASMAAGSYALFIVLFEIAGYLTQVVLMLKDRYKRLFCKGEFLSWLRMRMTLEVVKRHYDYAFYLNLVNLATLGFITLGVLILTSIYGTHETGLYSLAYSMASLPIQLIAMTTASIVYHKFIHISREERARLFPFFVKILMAFAILATVPYAVIYFWGSEIFALVFGKEWLASGEMASYLAVAFFFQFIYTPLSSIFRVGDRIKLQFWITLVTTILVSAAFYASAISEPIVVSIKTLSYALGSQGVVLLLFALFVAYRSAHPKENR